MSFDLMNDGSAESIPLTDGIIINQENSHNAWILELYIASGYRGTFDRLMAAGDVFEAHAVISFPDNEPAPFSLVVEKVKEIGDYVSVLCKGTLKAQRKRYAELLLQELIAEELPNDELLTRFERGMKERPKLKNT